MAVTFLASGCGGSLVRVVLCGTRWLRVSVEWDVNFVSELHTDVHFPYSFHGCCCPQIWFGDCGGGPNPSMTSFLFLSSCLGWEVSSFLAFTI